MKKKDDISLIKLEEIQNKHKDGQYVIIGEKKLSEKEKEKGSIEKEIIDQEIHISSAIDSKNESIEKEIVDEIEKLYFHPRGTYKDKYYKTIGYIACGGNEYIAVKKKKYGKLIRICLLPFVICMLVIGLYFLLNQTSNVEGIDPNAVDYESSLKRPDDMSDTEIAIPGYDEILMEKGSDTLNITLFNPEGNPCYFKFTIIDLETEEVLYESQLVAPGKGISPITLNKTFEEEGTYELMLQYETVDFEDTSINYNGANVNLTVNVE